MFRSLLAGAALALPLAALASGEPDLRFDADGARIVNAARDGLQRFDRATAGLIDAQGRLVGAGNGTGATNDTVIVRVTATGQPDSGFGSGGIVRIATPPGFTAPRVEGIVEQQDGRLVLGTVLLANGLSVVRLCRLMPNGAPDAQYGEGGCRQAVFWPESVRDDVDDIALQPDGRIVLLGATDIDADQSMEYLVARFDEDGTPDLCFGDASCQFGGFVVEPEPAADVGIFEPRALALAPDGRIVLAGAAGADMGAIRLLPTGAVDENFGDGGHRKIAFDQGGINFDQAEDVVVAPNGRVYLAGQVRTDTGILAGVAALDSAGDLIAAWGDNGRRVLFFNDVSANQPASGVALQDDGKLVIGGSASDNGVSSFDCGAARLDEQGDLDPLFGFAGYRGYDGRGYVDPAPRDTCHAIATRGGAIALFGDSSPDIEDRRDTLFIRIEQDLLMRDGFEAQP